MTNDPYMDAINAGAAALAKPYRDPDTISAFVETFPTIAAARVIDAALPYLRATILAEGVTPGPCPATTNFKRTSEREGGAFSARMMVALCDLRAGHEGQHEAQSDFGGHYRWTDAPPADADVQADTQCSSRWQREAHDMRVCELHAGHELPHADGYARWDADRGWIVR